MEILWVILGILVFAIVMTVLVSVHEGGHFIMAKKAGVLCHEFAIGMGPVIYQKKKGETLYVLIQNLRICRLDVVECTHNLLTFL